jgi:putative FmdB family regulatory protein
MPIYEYKCKSCDREFEVFQKASDDPLKECDRCTGELEKLISKSNFKTPGGDGFYDTGSLGKNS